MEGGEEREGGREVVRGKEERMEGGEEGEGGREVVRELMTRWKKRQRVKGGKTGLYLVGHYKPKITMKFDTDARLTNHQIFLMVC